MNIKKDGVSLAKGPTKGYRPILTVDLEMSGGD
jgi:hypothetical protein